MTQGLRSRNSGNKKCAVLQDLYVRLVGQSVGRKPGAMACARGRKCLWRRCHSAACSNNGQENADARVANENESFPDAATNVCLPSSLDLITSLDGRSPFSPGGGTSRASWSCGKHSPLSSLGICTLKLPPSSTAAVAFSFGLPVA